jgi:hypothetical protein
MDLRVFFFWQRHAVVNGMEEGFIFLDQLDAFYEVVVPFHIAHCGVEG